MGQTNERNNFDFIRVAAALCVLVSHMFALMGQVEPISVRNHSLGNIGLLTFFSVSGYLVTTSWTRDPNLWRFAVRRFLRIWPGLAVVVLICAFIVAPIFSDLSPWPYLTNLSGVTWYRDLWVFDSHAFKDVNGSLWTIPIEIWCYILLAAAGLLFRSKLSIAIIGVMALVGAYFAFVYGAEAGIEKAHVQFGKLFTAIYLGSFFAMGALLCLYEKPILHNPKVCWAIAAASAVSLICGQYMIGLWFGLPLLVILAGKASWPVMRDAGKYGDFSYGIYLYTWPVQQILVELLGSKHSVPIMAAATFAIVLPLSFLSWHLIEKHALKMKPAGKKQLRHAAG